MSPGSFAIWLCLAGPAWLGLSEPVSAQVSGGTLNGTVTDPSGAIVKGADVLVANRDTGQVRTTVSNERGFFSLPNVSPGAYDITVVAVGFAQAVQENVSIQVGQTVVANVQLPISSVQEKVDVVAASGDLSLASSTLSSIVKGDTVRDLPLNGRDWTMMAALEPGVHTIEAQSDLSGGGNARANRGWGTQMSFAGNRPQQNNYRLDGVSINDYSGGGPGGVLGSVLGVDAIQEFSVVTGNATADYGKTSGGVINAITRAGANQMHGSAYEFLRNDALDASNYFDNGVKPAFKRNQFGGSLGGPIRHDRMFYFVDFEGLRQDLGTTTLVTVPSTAARAGQLTSGAVGIDPLVAPYLQLYPPPNRGETGDTGTYAFVSDASTRDTLATGRVDYNFSASNTVHGTFLVDRSRTEAPNLADNTISQAVSNRGMASAEYTRTLRPTMVNILRFGYSSSIAKAPTWLSDVNPLLADPKLSFVPGREVGTIEVQGLTTIDGGNGGVGESDHWFHNYQLYEDFVWTIGAHAMKFGGAYERVYYDTTTSNAPDGRFVFGSIKSFLQNRATSFNTSIPGLNPIINLSQNVVGAYMADDFRVRPNLTLNLGLRYEMAGLPIEAHDRLATLVNITDPRPKLGSPYFRNPTLKNFAPRLGFAWDPFGSGKTSVRGGVGIYDTLPLLYQFALLVVNDDPYFRTGSLTTLPTGAFPTTAFNLITPNDNRVSYIQQNPDRSYVTQWNVNVERKLPGGLVAHVGYVGQHGVHQPFRTNDANIVLPTPTSDGLLQWPLPLKSGTRVNPNVGVINTLLWIGENTYNGLNVNVRHQARSLRTGASYTYGHSTDLSSSSTAGSNFINSIVGPFAQFPNVMKGRSDFDVRHNFVFNTVYTIPALGGRRSLATLLNGWQASAILRVASGLPFSALVGGDSVGMLEANSFNFADRLTTSGCGSAVNPDNPAHYVKTECFAFPAAGKLGNAGRNSLEGPGVRTVDVSLVKSARIERSTIQLRVECFNLLNRANFSVPNRTVSQLFNASGTPNSAAGALVSTSTAARQMQLALKFEW